MEEGDLFCFVYAERQKPQAKAMPSTNEKEGNPSSGADTVAPIERQNTAEGSMQQSTARTMFSIRMTEATCFALAQTAKQIGKTQRQFIAQLLANAGVPVHPIDLKAPPKIRSRA